MTFKDFTIKAIKVLREYNQPSKKTGKTSQGISVNYSGYNDLARKYFGADYDVRAAVDALLKSGEIEGHPVKGSFMIYLPGEQPKGNRPSIKELEQKFQEFDLVL